MTVVVVEREYENAITEQDIAAMAQEGGSCLSLYAIDWIESFLSASGKLLVCQFRAPDAETTRTALRQLGITPKAVWPASLHEAGSDQSPNVMVERRFEQAISLEALQAQEDASAFCLEAHNVSFVRTLFSLDRKRMLCLYHAPDAQSVREAQRKADMPVERVWACREIRPSLLM
jgi:hypothetical protein